MTPDELKALRKDASKKKRIATDWASKVHDLVEDSLWADYQSLTELACNTVAACEAWSEAQARFDEASNKASETV